MAFQFFGYCYLEDVATLKSQRDIRLMKKGLFAAKAWQWKAVTTVIKSDLFRRRIKRLFFSAKIGRLAGKGDALLHRKTSSLNINRKIHDVLQIT